ncbi:Putative DD37D maT transposase [Caligus rogercresseyi]|uniref:DD37D maT transposase n=1 Tax=Caligus rogercresseyi TaxID=217165 RepID=A0A7T8K056_CALRO|nr:Putative DD37D maT transposase [Caligus rogercresseyi]
MDLQSKRTTVLKLLDSGQSQKAIMNMVGKNWARKEVRTSRLSKAVAGKILHNPAHSINIMAQEYNVSPRTIGIVVKADLSMKLFKYRKIHLLNDATRVKRKAKLKLLLKWYADNPSVVVIFSDERLFKITNKLRDASKIPENTRNVYWMQKPASVMVWGTVESNGKKSPLLRIPDGVKINKTVYLDLLKNKVFPWMQKKFGGVSVSFQQDELRPILQRLCGTDIQPILGAAWNKSPEEIVRNSGTSVVKRLRAVVRANGGHVE